MSQDSTGLPHEMADRFTDHFARFLKIEALAGAALLLAMLAALILSNSTWSKSFLVFWRRRSACILADGITPGRCVVGSTMG